MSNVKSFKSANVDGNEFWILETMYRFSDKKYSHLSDEELEEYFCKQDISLKKQYSKVSTTLKYKGNLRISWAFDMQYNKNIDCIFFPEDNPYINYVALYARDFPKNIDKDDRYGIDRMLSANSLKIPYDINYDFVRGILLQDSLNKSNISPQYDKSLKEDLSNLETFLSHNLSQKSLQEQFFKVRFGSVFVPMEIEFEWYVVPWYIEYSPLLGKTYIQDIITFPNYDMYLHGVLDTPDPLGLCLGIIKSAKPLTQDTTIKFPPYIASWSEEEYNEQSQMNEEVTKHMSYAQIFTPLSTTALATTQTYVNDYIINLRDTPNKEGKIVAQLLTDSLKLPKDFFIQTHNGGVGYSHLSHGSGGAIAINPKYHKITELGSALYRKDTGDSSDWEVCFLYYYEKDKQTYFAKEKSKLINPLDSNTYLILVWNIDSNNWAKVWVLRMIRDTDWTMMKDKKISFRQYKDSDTHSMTSYRNKTLITFLNGSYKQTFLQSPSTLKLYEGYIHVSNLEYLYPFGENYIRK